MTGIKDLQTLLGTVAGAQPGARAAGPSNKGANTSPVATRTAFGSGQTLTVSPMAGQLAQAVNDSDVRLDKVLQIQSAIAAGTYKVSSADVADKLIAFMKSGR